MMGNVVSMFLGFTLFCYFTNDASFCYFDSVVTGITKPLRRIIPAKRNINKSLTKGKRYGGRRLRGRRGDVAASWNRGRDDGRLADVGQSLADFWK